MLSGVAKITFYADQYIVAWCVPDKIDVLTRACSSVHVRWCQILQHPYNKKLPGRMV